MACIRTRHRASFPMTADHRGMVGALPSKGQERGTPVVDFTAGDDRIRSEHRALREQRRDRAALGANAVVPVGSLQAADSPRLAGESEEHARTLAMTDSVLPPILVHRETMRVIDGMHRLRAAVLNGHHQIEVQFFDGSDEDAFVAAVQANIRHGLPLALADREAAATRIVGSHPGWSDRAIAEVAGLAPNTVAAIRSRLTAQVAQSNARIGRDGRLRPLSSAAGRRIAGQLLADHPGASLREIAKAAGISPATAMDVRERVRRGDDPVPPGQALAERKNGTVRQAGRSPDRAQGKGPARRHRHDTAMTLQKLQRDPAVRLTDKGRLLLQWLAAHAIRARDWEQFEAEIPAHAVPLVADLALGYSAEWRRFAETLQRKRTRKN
jgi:ParB-like chromosome segregation protein Spo0J